MKTVYGIFIEQDSKITHPNYSGAKQFLRLNTKDFDTEIEAFDYLNKVENNIVSSTYFIMSLKKYVKPRIVNI